MTCPKIRPFVIKNHSERKERLQTISPGKSAGRSDPDMKNAPGRSFFCKNVSPPAKLSHVNSIHVVSRWSPGAVAVCLIALLISTESRVLAEPPQIQEPKHAEYRIVIHCSGKVLQLWRFTDLVREYPVDVGKGGLAKRRGGDHRTPIGDYEISWMASRQGKKGDRVVDGKSWCSGNRFVYGTTGPKLEKLWTDSYGGDEAAIMSIDYPNAADRARGFTGECIHIHADKHLVEGALKKSYGCIHMFPANANELYDRVDVGTPVKILP